MEIYILRHGIAEEHSDTGLDEDRQLTGEGRKKLRETLKALARAGVKPTCIVSSPYARAVQTARIAAEELAFEGDIEKSAAFVPGAAPQDAWNEIRMHREEDQLLVSSHNPLCAELAAYLLAAPNLWIDFKKGAVLRIDMEQFGAQPHGLLKWMLAPKLAGA